MMSPITCNKLKKKGTPPTSPPDAASPHIIVPIICKISKVIISPFMGKPNIKNIMTRIISIPASTKEARSAKPATIARMVSSPKTPTIIHINCHYSPDSISPVQQ